jgi:DoxX-like family
MNIVSWSAQFLAAAVFGFSAVTKGTWSKEKLVAKGQTGVAAVPLPLVRFVAFAELLGVIGLIVPWWTGIGAVLTPLAAIGLSGVMVGAAIIHLRLGEPRTALGNVALLAVCMTVAVGRLAQLN